MHTGVYKGQRQNLEKCQENMPVNQQPVRSQENIHCPRSNSSWETRRPSIVEKTQISKRHSAQSGLRHKRSAHSPVPRASIDQRSTQGWNPHRPTQNGESWQNRSTQPSSVSDSEFRTLYTENTYTSERRGGILLLVKQELNPTHYEKSDADAEILLVSLALKPKLEWLVGVCYRPEVDVLMMMEKICDLIHSTDNENILLFGDFNFRNINWDDYSGTRKVEQDFIDAIRDHFLTQIVNIPTRGDNILDLALLATQRPSHAVRHFHH